MKKVLIPVDDTPGTGAIFSVFAGVVRPAEEVLLLHVGRIGGKSLMYDMLGDAEIETLKEAVKDTPFQERLDARAGEILAHYKGKLEGIGATNVRTLFRTGIPSEEILRVAEEEKVELIVMGCNGKKGLRRLVSGCATKDVERGARVPVLVAKTGGCEEAALGWREAYAAR